MVTTGSVFVGRQREMALLQAALEEALSGKGRLVMLVGEPGIGKTRTAQELAAAAGQRGAHALALGPVPPLLCPTAGRGTPALCDGNWGRGHR